MEQSKDFKKEFIDNSANSKTYRIAIELDGDLSYMAIGTRVASSVLYDNGYNILDLVASGHILNINEPYEWQRKLVGKNEHTVYSWCPACLSFGVNLPLDNTCGNCGYARTRTYYDADTIDLFLQQTQNPR